MIIAIDGPAASGKGTLAGRIAEYFGFPCLDTGLLYRAVAREVLARSASLEDEDVAVAVARTLDPRTLADPRLRLPGVGEAASTVARIPAVRTALLAFQRDFARRPPGAVLDGRDIGTVVCPDADVKIFITADVEVRAQRRFLELRARGEPATFVNVLALIRRRDERDSGRASAPLRRADDAILLDTTNLDIDAAVDAAVGLIKRKIGQ
jgi:cytidylate kinase